MSTMAECMDGLAGLIEMDNVYAWPAKKVSVPCGLIGYPENVDFDLTFQDGGITYTFPVWLIVGLSETIDSRARLSERLSGVGSFKAALDGSHPFGSVRVTDAEVAEITVASETYIGLKFMTEVVS